MILYLFDTNHVSGLRHDDEPITSRVLARASSDFAVSLPSVGELWFMVCRSSRWAENRRRLLSLLRGLTLSEFDQSAAIEFGRIKAELRAAGTPIPDIDIQIAATARSRGLVLLTGDVHFSYVSGLTTENWLVP